MTKQEMSDPGGSLLGNAKKMGKALMSRGKDYQKFVGQGKSPVPKKSKKKIQGGN